LWDIGVVVSFFDNKREVRTEGIPSENGKRQFLPGWFRFRGFGGPIQSNPIKVDKGSLLGLESSFRALRVENSSLRFLHLAPVSPLSGVQNRLGFDCIGDFGGQSRLVKVNQGCPGFLAPCQPLSPQV